MKRLLFLSIVLGILFTSCKLHPYEKEIEIYSDSQGKTFDINLWIFYTYSADDFSHGPTIYNNWWRGIPLSKLPEVKKQLSNKGDSLITSMEKVDSIYLTNK